MKGLRDVACRLATGPAKIAYMGNSVTAQKDGYRPFLHAGLVKHFGHDHKLINAGFGGVGSIGSVCTMDDLVIRHRPALCFIECMTGDMGVGLHADTGPALEGMLRKLAANNCSACFLNLPRGDADFSRADPIALLYRRVAEHHGTPSVDLGQDLESEGPDFFRDVVHTTTAGGRRTADLILAAMESIFADSPSPQPLAPLFTRDYVRASIAPVRAEMLRDPAACTRGRFRFAYPLIEIGPDNDIYFHSGSDELLGLLIVVGPHSGTILVDGAERQLRDRWSHYERLHAYVFERHFPAGRTVTIAPLEDTLNASVSPRLKIIGFLVRST